MDASVGRCKEEVTRLLSLADGLSHVGDEAVRVSWGDPQAAPGISAWLDALLIETKAWASKLPKQTTERIMIKVGRAITDAKGALGKKDGVAARMFLYEGHRELTDTALDYLLECACLSGGKLTEELEKRMSKQEATVVLKDLGY